MNSICLAAENNGIISSVVIKNENIKSNVATHKNIKAPVKMTEITAIFLNFSGSLSIGGKKYK